MHQLGTKEAYYHFTTISTKLLSNIFALIQASTTSASWNAGRKELSDMVMNVFLDPMLVMYATFQPSVWWSNIRAEGSNNEEAISQLWEELLREGVTCAITRVDLSPIAVPSMCDRLAEQGTSDKFIDLVDSPFPSSVHATLPVVVRVLIRQAPYGAT